MMLEKFFGFDTSVEAKSADIANQKQELEKLLKEFEERSRDALNIHAKAQDSWEGGAALTYSSCAEDLNKKLSGTTEEIGKYSTAVSQFCEKIESIERGFKDLLAESKSEGFPSIGSYVLPCLASSASPTLTAARVAQFNTLVGKHDDLRAREVQAHAEFAAMCGIDPTTWMDGPLGTMLKAFFLPPISSGRSPLGIGWDGVKVGKWVLDRIKDGYDIKTILSMGKKAEFMLVEGVDKAKGMAWRSGGGMMEEILGKRGSHTKFPTSPKEIGLSFFSSGTNPLEQLKGATDSKHWKPLAGVSEDVIGKSKKALDFGGKAGKGLTVVKYGMAGFDAWGSGKAQWEADSHNPSLSGMEKVTRTVAKAGWDVAPGLAGGSAGTAAGAAIGTAICPGVGTVIGGVVGGWAGGSLADGGKNLLDGKVTGLIDKIGK